jgi:hypothetical protein
MRQGWQLSKSVQSRKSSVEVWAYCHLFQSRFALVAMDESHLRSAVSYVSLNPVRAGFCLVQRTGCGQVCGRTSPARMTAWYLCVLCSTAGVPGIMSTETRKKKLAEEG